MPPHRHMGPLLLFKTRPLLEYRSIRQPEGFSLAHGMAYGWQIEMNSGFKDTLERVASVDGHPHLSIRFGIGIGLGIGIGIGIGMLPRCLPLRHLPY